MEAYNIREAVKSQLNILTYNASGRKKKIFVSLYMNKNASDSIFPKKYKGWVLENASAHVRDHGKGGIFLNYAYYSRDMTASEVEQFIKEEFGEDHGFE